MAWNFSKEQSIYTQIVEHIKISIISGEYKLGEKIPSVRELAVTAAVNPNTMQKALQELEKMNLVFTQRTSGRFITEDKAMVDKLKEDFAKKQIIDFYKKMKSIGLTKNEIINFVEKTFGEMN